MVHKINNKKDIKDMINVAEDIRHLSEYSRCLLSFKGIDCIECNECSRYGQLVAVSEFLCDFECDVDKCNDCSVIYYDAYAYLEDEISQEDVHKFAYELDPIDNEERTVQDN